jgi:group I intron endonuclease
MGIIYLHTNQINGKVYVGQTWDTLREGWLSHTSHARRYRGRCPHFHAAIRKYGPEVFDHQVLATADTQEKLDNHERVWIILLRSNDPEFGYNIRSGGGRGYHSESSRAKMRGRVGGGPRRGFRYSEELNQRVAAASTGKTHSPETRRKMSEGLKRKYATVWRPR